MQLEIESSRKCEKSEPECRTLAIPLLFIRAKSSYIPNSNDSMWSEKRVKLPMPIEYCLAAEFDIDKGSSLSFQYPPDSITESPA
jgi:hypothetical protein